ncbi:hypothetical protein ACP43V_09260 [Vibrio genomosp. F10 str. 9ZC157]|nr:hypothetical protein [Vibrio genomosp. F10]
MAEEQGHEYGSLESIKFAPGESGALHELLPDVSVKTIPNSWMPNAYIIK